MSRPSDISGTVTRSEQRGHFASMRARSGGAYIDAVRQRLDARKRHHVHAAAVAADRDIKRGDIGKAVPLDIEREAGMCPWRRLDGNHPALRDLRRCPKHKHAEIAADIEHVVGGPQLEARMQIALPLVNFPA